MGYTNDPQGEGDGQLSPDELALAAMKAALLKLTGGRPPVVDVITLMAWVGEEGKKEKAITRINIGCPRYALEFFEVMLLLAPAFFFSVKIERRVAIVDREDPELVRVEAITHFASVFLPNDPPPEEIAEGPPLAP